jgi:lantibiotic biosynthesis protein
MIIYEKMAIAFNMSAHQVTSLLAQMLSLQLLFTEDTVNITGQDYFQRTGIRGKSGFCSYMITERKWLSGALDAQAMRELPQALNFLSKYLPDIENKDLTNFRIAFLKKFENTVVPLMTALDSEIGIGYASLGEQQADFQIKEILKDLRGDDKDEQHILYSGLNRFLIAQLMKGGTIRLDEYKNEALYHIKICRHTCQDISSE